MTIYWLQRIFLLRFYLLFFSCLLSNVNFGQDYTYVLDEYDFDDGLVYRQINTIFEDRDGFIWLGTNKGLLRYDGEEFKVWNSEDDTGLIHSIKLITQDDEGILWLWNSAIMEFVFLNPYSGKIQSVNTKFGDSFPSRLDGNSATVGFSLPGRNIFRSSEGRILLSTEGLEFYYSYHSSTGFKKIPIKRNIAIIGACINDTLYLLSGRQMHKQDGMISRYSIDGEYYDERKVTSDQYHYISLLLKLPQTTNRKAEISNIFKGKEPAPSEFMQRLSKTRMTIVDSINNCAYTFSRNQWLALSLQNDTLLNLNAQHFKNADLFRNESYMLDSRNNLWTIGHFGLARLKIEKNKFHKLLSKRGGNNEAIRGLFADSNYIYVNAENTNQTYKIAKSDNSIVNKVSFDIYPRPILKMSDGTIMIGGVHMYVSDTNLINIESLKFEPEDPYWWGNNYGIWSVYEDTYGNTWAGKGKFLACKRKDDSIFTAHGPSESYFNKLGNKQCILAIIPEGKDSLWLCSEGGLFLFDIQKDRIIRHFHETSTDYLPASRFYHLYKDDEGIYWLGTNSGLIEWKGPELSDEFEHYTVKNNLSNDVIYGIYEDQDDRLWMSSDYGIMNFGKESKVVHTYLEKNGISHYEFNRTSHFQDEMGNIYFGGLNGVTYFDPADFTFSSKENTPLVISEFEIFDGKNEKLIDKTADLLKTRKIKFKPSDKYFKLKFSLPTFDGKSNKIYAWMIEGIHSDWNYQNSNLIEIGMLPYGDYKLKIKGRTKESSWAKDHLQLDLEVVKPFYKTIWFLLISLVLLVSSIITFFKLRTRLLKKKIEEATIQIVSDKKIIEKQSEDLKKLDKLKTQFFTNVSHELRTPLTLMMGPIKRLMNTISNQQSDDRQMLDILHRNTVQLRKLVDEILDLSKLENKKMLLDETPVNLHLHVSNLLKQYYSFYSSEEVTFTADLQIDQSLILMLDLKKFDKILNNFLANALKFTSRNGIVKLDMQEKENSIQIMVKDSGRGIHPDDLPYIFDRFYQSTNNDFATEGGTGIGLSLCKELSELMHGKVWATSTSGIGSIFYFTFPITKVDAESLKVQDVNLTEEAGQEELLEPSHVQEILREKTILVVEDNKDLREYQRIILSDYNVVLTENGKTAMDYLKANTNPDLILSDLMMPVMDGMELVERVKSIDQFRHIPFVMLTAKTNQQVKIKALRYGIDDYLTKPFDDEELRVRISNLLQIQKNRMAVLESDNNHSENAQSETKHHLSQPDLQWLEELENFVIENLKNEFLSVTLLSKEMSMSESTLLRQLKRLTGMTPGKYIQELRLNKAREYLLNNTFKTISLVSYNVGFKDSNSFSRTFKKRFGKRPSDIGK